MKKDSDLLPAAVMSKSRESQQPGCAHLQRLGLQRLRHVGEQVGVLGGIGERLRRLGVDLPQVLPPQPHHLFNAQQRCTVSNVCLLQGWFAGQSIIMTTVDSQHSLGLCSETQRPVHVAAFA